MYFKLLFTIIMMTIERNECLFVYIVEKFVKTVKVASTFDNHYK